MPMNMQRAVSKAVAAFAVAMVSFGAHAAPLLFALTGDYTASWSLDSEQAPNFAVSGVNISFWNVHGSFPSVPSNSYIDLEFRSSTMGGGLEIWTEGGAMVLSSGPQLYTGSEVPGPRDPLLGGSGYRGPKFKLGSFALTNMEYRGRDFMLTISESAAVPELEAVPEPATLALVLAALGVLAMLPARRR